MEENDTAKNQDNVFLRLLNLPSVSAALKPIEQTYLSMKRSHPVVSSVCALYETGVSKAGRWAVWSMKPALRVLEPKLIAVNSMACRRLDHWEEKIPALQSPPAELAASIKVLVSLKLEAAKDSIASPIKRTSNTVLCKVSSGYQESKITFSDNIQNVLNSKHVCLAQQRLDRALTLTENWINHMFPASAIETEDDSRAEEPKPDAVSTGLKPSLSRLGALAGTIYKRAFEKTAAQLQHTTSQSQKLITNVPGVTPLVDYTKRGVKTIGSVLLRSPNSDPKDGEQYSAELTTNESEEFKSNELQKLVSGLGQQFQKAYGSMVTNVKKSVGEDGVAVILTSFGTARKTLHNLINRQSNVEEDPQPYERDEKVGEESQCGSMEQQFNGADPVTSRPDNSEEHLLKPEEPVEISEETQKKGHEADSGETESGSLSSNQNISNQSPSEKSQDDPAQMPSTQS